VELVSQSDVLLTAGGTVSMPAMFLPGTGSSAVTVTVPGLGGEDHMFEDQRLWASWAHIRTVFYRPAAADLRYPPPVTRGLTAEQWAAATRGTREEALALFQRVARAEMAAFDWLLAVDVVVNTTRMAALLLMEAASALAWRGAGPPHGSSLQQLSRKRGTDHGLLPTAGHESLPV
jgi:hypothetical protein